jgi:hypothetical protein
VYVQTAEVDALHGEWRDCGLLPVPGAITPELRPWGVREFAIRDLDNNHLRFGRQIS